MAKKRNIAKLRHKEKSISKKEESDEEDESEKRQVIAHGKGKTSKSKSKSKSSKYEEVDEDDSIDDDGSEIGWNSDDEAAYGQLFKKKSNTDDDFDDSEPQEDDDEDEMEGQGMLLSDMLSSPTPSQHLTSHSKEDDDEEEDAAEEEDDDDDEEDGEDGEQSEEDSEISDQDQYAFDDEDDNPDDGDHDRLLAAIEKYSKSNQSSSSSSSVTASNAAAKSNSKMFQLSTESPFSALQSNQTISLESLLTSLQTPGSKVVSSGGIDQETLKFVQSNLQNMNSSVNAPKYTHKVQADRAERSITYQDTSSDMKKWQHIIATNNAAKSLDLRQDKRSLPSTRGMITSYQPQTEMEKEIQMILLHTKNETDIEKNEEDELLHSKELTHEEIQEKQKELAKIKSLLFFEQMKRHRINKIKSKTFHRILKKKKMKKQLNTKEYNELIHRLKTNGDIAEEDLEGDDEDWGEGGGSKETEEESLRRIKERMNLRHKNTGKWARMALEHGKGSKSLREAYHEAVLLGNELSKKATTLNENDDPYQEDLPRHRNDNDQSDDDHGDDVDGGDGGRKRKSKKLRIVDEASESLENILNTGSQESELNGKYKALFEMDFMKKAREQKQLRAKEDAQQLLREIELMEEGVSDSDNEIADQTQQQQHESKKKLKELTQKRQEKLELARKQMSNLMNGSNSMSLVTSSSSSNATANTTGGEVTTQSNPVQPNPWLDPTTTKTRDLQAIIGETNNKGKTLAGKNKNKNSVVKSNDKEVITHLHDIDVGGGVDVGVDTKTETKIGKSLQSKSKKSKLSDLSVTAAATMATKADKADTQTSKNEKSEPTRKPLLMQKSQQDLVNLAFSGPDYESDFNTLKEKIIDEELNISDKKRKILADDKAGWGDWAGPGLVGVSHHVIQKRQRLLKNIDEKKAELRAGRSDGTLANVILSEKRIKTTSRYKLSDIPHPFTSREEYERSLQMPIGNEWNTEHIVRKNTKPELLLRTGRIIEPIKLPKQRKSSESSRAK